MGGFFGSSGLTNVPQIVAQSIVPITVNTDADTPIFSEVFAAGDIPNGSILRLTSMMKLVGATGIDQQYNVTFTPNAPGPILMPFVNPGDAGAGTNFSVYLSVCLFVGAPASLSGVASMASTGAALDQYLSTLGNADAFNADGDIGFTFGYSIQKTNVGTTNDLIVLNTTVELIPVV